MEEQNNSGAENQAQGAPQALPALTAAPAAQAPSQTAYWLKAVALLYAVSLLAAFVLISRADSAKKAKTGDMDLSKLSSMMQSTKGAVAVIPIYGAISQGDSSRSWDRGSMQIAKRIKKMAEKKEVKAIMLDINSPGGSVGAVQEIYSTVMRARRETKKPFIAHFGDVSASGGYYIASACDMIIAQPGTITGSIGVIFSVSNFDGLMKKVGMHNEAIKSGKFKDIGSPMREMTADERKLLQALIDDSYDQFVTAVAEGRKMPMDKVKELADGRIYSGRQALAKGLVDKLGDMQDALDAAGELGKLGKNPRVLNEGDPLDNFMSLMESKLDMPGSKVMSEALETSPRLEYRWYGH